MALLERERELELLSARLLNAGGGHGCVVVVEGVAGIAKQRSSPQYTAWPGTMDLRP
jgi:predicted ATPase